MFNSIRTKLTIWYLSILALIIIAFALATYFLVKHNLNETTNNNLSAMANNVAGELHKEDADIAEENRLIAAEGGIEKNSDEIDEKVPTIEEAIIEEINDLKFIGYRFAVFDPKGNNLVSTISNANIQSQLKDLSSAETFSDITDGSENFRVHQTSLMLDGRRFRLFVTQPLEEQNEFLFFFQSISFGGILIALLLAGIGGYFLAKRSLMPVVAMSSQAEKISASNLNERLPIRNETDELGDLAKVFNSLLSRLEESFNQQQRFMADASHELRTPLAIIRTEAEVAISKDKRQAKEYRESLSVVHDESERLTNIVEDLFLLARADRGQIQPRKELVHLDEIITGAVHSVRTLVVKRKLKIRFSDLPEMPINADESLLHRLFLNLFDNAIK